MASTCDSCAGGGVNSGRRRNQRNRPRHDAAARRDPSASGDGYADLQKGIDGLAVTVQQVLGLDPFSGDLFVFRGHRADMLKILFWDGTGLCLLTKRLETGAFPWPVAQSGVTSISAAQFSMLLEGLDWKRPERVWRPAIAG
jgi:transposase